MFYTNTNIMSSGTKRNLEVLILKIALREFEKPCYKKFSIRKFILGTTLTLPSLLILAISARTS